MLAVTLNPDFRIAILEPSGPLSPADFKAVGEVIDPAIESAGGLIGLVVHTKDFPGWDSFSGLVSHFKFVRDHHKKVRRVAICTDSNIGKFAEAAGSHFVNAEVKAFGYAQLETAKEWAGGTEQAARQEL